MTDKEQQWDQVLGDKLRRLQPDYRAESWDALADRLRQEEADMANPVDAAVVAAIEKIQPEFRADSWDKMSALLDAEESIFDQQVASAVNNIQPAYRSGSWAALAARLELAAHRRIAIWQTKSLEVATAFVLLLAFWVFFPYFLPQPPVDATPAAQSLAARVDPVAEYPTQEVRSAPAASPTATDTNPAATDSRNLGYGLQAGARSKVAQPLPAEPALASNATDGAATVASQSPNSVKQLPSSQLSGVNPIVDYRRPDYPFAFAELPVTPLAAADLELLADNASADEITRKLRRAARPPVQTWGLIGTHWDQNVVFTPSFTLRRQYMAETRLSRGRTVGVTYSRGHGRQRWETGLLYRMKQYFPSYVVLTDERERAVNRMRYHSVSIPLSYQPTIARVGRWSAYLNVGASFNVTLDAHITIEDVYRSSLQNPGVPRSEEARRAENFGEHRGLLQGGQFSNNATVYTLVGAGVAYRLPTGLSFFLQPTATRRIIDFGGDGEGPLRERINSNSILFGFKREF